MSLDGEGGEGGREGWGGEGGRGREGGEGGREGWEQCLSQDFDFFQKRSYLICLGSYLQKRGVIYSQ